MPNDCHRPARASKAFYSKLAERVLGVNGFIMRFATWNLQLIRPYRKFVATRITEMESTPPGKGGNFLSDFSAGALQGCQRGFQVNGI